jgi:hypothetical protein
MTKAKRVEKLKHFITCLKCEVSGKCCDNNCPTQYNAGNMGEIIENLEEIARALEQEQTTKNDLGVDCISRKQAIDAFPDLLPNMGYNKKAITEILQELPSVIPQLSSELEKNSKKLEKGTTENDLEVDCISRDEVCRYVAKFVNHEFSTREEEELIDNIITGIERMPSVTPQLSVPEVTALAEWTEKLTKASEDAYNKGYADGMKAQEPRKGHWITQWNPAHQKEYYYCSECREEYSYDGETGIKMNDYNFCPNCGSDNREVKE